MGLVLVSVLLWTSEAACPAPMATVPGRLMEAVPFECSAVLLTDRALLKVGPGGVVERSFPGQFGGASLRLDEARSRLFVVTPLYGELGLEVTIEARSPTTLALETAWGRGGAVRFTARRLQSKPHVAAGGGVNLQVRSDGSATVVTRADSVGASQSVLQSWSLDAKGVLGEPVTLAELDSSSVGGVLVFALAPDGRGLVAASHAKTLRLLGLSRNGRLEPTFGDRGVILESDIVFPVAALADRDGWVLTGTGNGTGKSYRVVVARYLRSGAVDKDYAAGGKQVVARAGPALEHPRAMAWLPSGSALIIGSRYWRSEKRARLTAVTLSAVGRVAEVRELDLGKEPYFDAMSLFIPKEGAPQLAGIQGASSLDREGLTFWRGLDPIAGEPAPATAVGPAPSAPLRVFRWTDADGAEGFASSLDEVPPAYRSKVRADSL